MGKISQMLREVDCVRSADGPLVPWSNSADGAFFGFRLALGSLALPRTTHTQRIHPAGEAGEARDV